MRSLFILSLLCLPWSIAKADLVLTMGGDINFNKTALAPIKDRVNYPDGPVLHTDLIKYLRPLMTGDLNFANIETVVSDRDLPRAVKTFTFVSHQISVRELAKIGFNLFSLANNHAWDAKSLGYGETLKWMKDAESERPIYYAGLGQNRNQALAPRVFDVTAGGSKYRVAFSAISFADPNFAATDLKAGIINLRNPKDLKDFMLALRATSANFKIISIHTGTEGQVTLDENQAALFHSLIDVGDADLIIGSHPHVVRPVEIYKGRLIFYSLGNYMMPGSADISGRAIGYGNGLHAKTYWSWSTAQSKMVLQAVEAVPLTQVHKIARPITGALGHAHIDFLNRLSKSQVGTRAIEFSKVGSGRGLYCAATSEISSSDRASKICGH